MGSRSLALAAALVLAGCSPADNGPQFCVGTFADGSTAFGCASCTGLNSWDDSPLEEAIDNDPASYRDFALGAHGSIVIRIDAPPGMSFPAGVDAGALLRFPAGVEISAQWTLYDGDAALPTPTDATIAEAAVPAAAGADWYYAVTPGATFDRLDLAISTVAPAQFRLYEACGDR